MEKITHVVFDHDGTLVDTSRLERSLYPGIKDLVHFLADNNISMYVWTARSYASTKEILNKLGLASKFIDICGSNNAPGKPSPAGLEYLIPEVEAQNVIVIGDSLGDIIGGTKFGAHCIGASWGHGDETVAQMYAEYGAKASFLTVEECKQYIAKLI